MTRFRIEPVRFSPADVRVWAELDPLFRNWPIVYTLSDSNEVYVGESLNVAARFRQHLESEGRQHLVEARAVVDETFNKSVCLDLESYLIRLFAGDGRYRVLNRNEGVTDADYYGRREYQQTFDLIFGELQAAGMFTRPQREIENSDLFKLSPFKALAQDQAAAVEDILEGLFDDIEAKASSRIVIQGDPGTGKTVVAIFILKLLSDIRDADLGDASEGESIFSDFFVGGYSELLVGFRAALVIPQQSLRKSIQRVFNKTPGLSADMVLSPFQVGHATQKFDLLIVDEAHRLGQRAAQASGPQNKDFAEITIKLFGEDDRTKTQLDWIDGMSTHQVFLVDAEQSVRPSDLPPATLSALIRDGRLSDRYYPLLAQHRVKAGSDFVPYIRGILSTTPPAPTQFPGYDFRFFNSLAAMRSEIRNLDREHGLARLIAGYAWEWRSKKDPSAHDIEVDGVRLRWNTVAVDWVNSKTSLDEVGSIHTIQGYDLNYAGVIIGRDLRFDPAAQRVRFDRNNYFDARGKANNKILGLTYSDEDLLQFVKNIYAVLLTRGIRGTFVYVCDPHLREYLRQFVCATQ